MKNLKTMLCMTALLLFGVTANAATVSDSDIPVDITVNNNYIKTDAISFIDYDTTYVPIRFVSQALCVDDIIWDEKYSSVSIIKGDKNIQLQVGNNFANVNGNTVKLEKTVKLVNDRVFVPVRFIAQALGADVSWNSEYLEVNITKDDITVPNDVINNEYSKEDILWLSRIIEAESSGEPLVGKIAVGNVVINRVKSPSFPNTISEVIFDTKYGVQFQPVSNGSIYNTPSLSSVVAAKRALLGENIVSGSLYFLNPRIATNFWIIENRTFYTSINNHDFYL